MNRRAPARCRTCHAPVVFFRSPFTSKVRTFDTAPVPPSHPAAGVAAFPVLGGTASYRPTDLSEVLQQQRQCSDEAAREEIRDLPWHQLHTCPTTNTTSKKENSSV